MGIDDKSQFRTGLVNLVGKPFRSEDLLEKMAEHLGVVFLYEEEDLATDAAELSSADLEPLPEPWRHAVGNAASTADEKTLLTLIDEIAAEHADLARGLRDMVHQFRFEEIVQLTSVS